MLTTHPRQAVFGEHLAIVRQLLSRWTNQYQSVPFVSGSMIQTGTLSDPATWAVVLDVVMTISTAAT